jgi:oxygen-independent coproporphyrinogen III oxidase
MHMAAAALYIHVPFCEHKCIYCDFYSITDRSLSDAFVLALLQESTWNQHNPPFGGFAFSTLYFGGGTPSLLAIEQLETFITGQPLLPDAEITLEANPGTVSLAYLQALRRIGVNRLSIGIQSFVDEELRTLSRIHTAVEAERSILWARQAGFTNISLDFIFAIPGQTMTSLTHSLARAISFGPEHISCYSLTVEKETPLAVAVEQGVLHTCAEDQEEAMMVHVKKILEAAGYEQYEISNYARPNQRSRHNQSYWNGTPYLGLGPAAHSFDGQRRWWNSRDVVAYISAWQSGQGDPAGSETITPSEKTTEAILLGLRRKEGITDPWLINQLLPIVQQLGGIDPDASPFQPSEAAKWFTRAENGLCLTLNGLLLYNHVCEELCSRITIA